MGSDREARCYLCNGAEDNTINPADGMVTRELRPYGPGGAWVCYDCAMSTPERREQTKKAIHRRMDAIEDAGDIVTITDEGESSA